MAAILDMPIKNLIPDIDFMHTISRDLTHKRRLENVYVTSTSQLSEHDFAAGAYIPQANEHLNGMRGWRNDVTLTVIEIGRQLGIAICHAYLGVERANVFVLNTMKMETLPAFHTTDWTVQDMISARFSVDNRTYRNDGSLSGVHATGDFYTREGQVCRISSDWVIQPIESGKRLRDISRTRNMRAASTWNEVPPPFEGFRIQPIFPARSSVLDDTLWAASNGSTFAATLRVDLDNLFFFDHENDHVPGMLILEGMRELAIDVGMRFPRTASEHPRITRADVAFKNFAELDHTVELVAELEDKIDATGNKELYIRVEARQFGKVVSEGRFIVS
jgi:hypothetical protein